MSFWDTLIRKDSKHAFQRAWLEVRGHSDIERVPFSFSTISDDRLSAEESSMHFGFDKRSKGIFTYDYKLPFVTGARVSFRDGTSMVVSSIISVVDEEKAQADGQGIIGLNIYFGA